jgi:crotonobetaine/carnitine-CoA ligase
MEEQPRREDTVLRHLVERNATESPHRHCITFENESLVWSCAEVRDEGYRAANALTAAGVQRGDRVMIMLANGSDWVRAWLGISFLGAVVVPVNIAFRGNMIDYMVRDADPRLIITADPFNQRFSEVAEAHGRLFDPALLRSGSTTASPLAPALEPWDIAAVNYTSGTTGRSKGVLTTHSHVTAQGVPWHSRINPGEVYLSVMPMFHISGTVPLTAVWRLRGHFILCRYFEASRFLDIARSTRASMSFLVGSMSGFMESFEPSPRDKDHSLRCMIVAPLPPDPNAFIKRYGLHEILQVLAMTEMAPACMTSGPILDRTSCGAVQPGFEVRVVDENDYPVPVGQPGELVARTVHPWIITPGYLNKPEETARAWRNGWFHTGDGVYLDEAGEVHFVDRIKDVIRRRGENISSLEVATEILAHPAVADVACVPTPGDHAEDEVLAYVVLAEDKELEPAVLIEFLIPRLSHFAVPRYIEFVADLPRTQTMKVRKDELRKRGRTEATWDREAAGITLTRSASLQ